MPSAEMSAYESLSFFDLPKRLILYEMGRGALT
jgi:hypothetical protein